MLEQQRDAERAHERPGGNALYRRAMPGGGYVEVELEPRSIEGESTAHDAPHRGRIVVERRADSGRRTGHTAPVVAEITGEDLDELTSELFRLAHDNAALARRLMRWQGRSRAD